MESRLIVLRTYSLYNNGLIDKAKLEGAGINCFLKEDSTGLVQPFFSEGGGGIKLMVMAAEAEIAETILNDHSESTSPNEEATKIVDEENNSQIKNSKTGCFSLLAIAVVVTVAICYIIF
jgi:hypothetical protein